MSSAHRWYERRHLRRLERRRRRRSRRRDRLAGHPATPARGVRGLRARIAAAARGDRPLVVALTGAVVLALVVLSGPAQSYLDGRARVDGLEAKLAALDEENARLEQRTRDLEDPLNVELLAREQQGFIRPGEVPYTLVPPEVERPQITAPRGDDAAEAGPWYQRAWESLRGWLG